MAMHIALVAMALIGVQVAYASTVLRENGNLPLVQGQDLRLHELHETTSWPFLEDVYNSHNGYRLRHGVGELRLNRTLVDYARVKSLIVAWYDGSPPPEKEGEGPMFGENYHWAEGATGPVNGTEAVDKWYSEGSAWNYGSSEPQLNDSNRQFAQVVWRRARRFGCGQSFSKGPKGGVHTVCYYDPTIVAGEESANVQKPLTDEVNLQD